jgi:hypothetical protein
MKRSAGWSMVVMILCVTAAYREFAAGPFEFQPNWFVILPLVALWAVLAGILIRKERMAAESHEQEADAEVATAYTKALERVDRETANA